ncbi:MAG: winged helix-turn-helix transcriptional regulator [Spirochaetia bacterium]|nr:winged helix-turn-helix transcriptional regulator [Spirochaetia bacterium]
MKNNPEISVTEISKQLGISVKAVEKQFALLREKGRIKREGPPNGGK